MGIPDRRHRLLGTASVSGYDRTVETTRLGMDCSSDGEHPLDLLDDHHYYAGRLYLVLSRGSAVHSVCACCGVVDDLPMEETGDLLVTG